MLELLLKASFIIGIALLFYKTVLQQESFFAVNRLFLICCLVLAFALPYISLPKLVNHQGYLVRLVQEMQPATGAQQAAQPTDKPALDQQTTNTAVNAVEKRETRQQALPAQEIKPETANTTESTIPEEPTNWFFWLAALYLFGVAIFSLNLLFQLGSIFLKIARSPDKIVDGDCVIVNTAGKQAPCSFFKYIFIYPDDYDFETYEQILAHEKIHVRQKHSLDLLVAELAVIVLWFNPMIWFFKREVEKNIEFQTDALLLNQVAIGKQQYQLSLLQIAAPNKPLTITTNYNQSLLKQRILMMNAKKSTLHGYWKYAFLAPLLFGTMLLINEPATSQTTPTPIPGNATATPPLSVHTLPKPAGAEVPETPPAPSGDGNDMSTGYWYSQQKNGQYCLQLKGDLSRNNWSISDCYDVAGFVKKSEDLFLLTKESGTLTLTGKLDQEVGQGKYVFTKDPAFEQYLASNNIESKEENLVLFLFLNDVGKEYISFLKNNYPDMNGERLLEVAIHSISQEDFQTYISLFQQYSNKKPSMQEVVEAEIHGIDAAYIEEMQAMGFKDLSMKKMMEARIHDVDRAYVEELQKAGFSNLSINKIIEAKIHDLDASSINEIRELGFDLNLDKIIEVKIHDVDANFIKELNAAGFTNLDIDQILEAKIHDIDATNIKEIQALNDGALSLEKIVEGKIHDVDAAFVEELASAGFTDLSWDKIVEARIHDVDGDFIKRARAKGFNYKSIDRYIQLSIHDMLSDEGEDE